MPKTLQVQISECENYISVMREDLYANEKHLHNLYLELQLEEASVRTPWYADIDEAWCSRLETRLDSQSENNQLNNYLNEADIAPSAPSAPYDSLFNDEEYQNELYELAIARQKKIDELEAGRQKELDELATARQNELDELMLKEERTFKEPLGTKLKWILNQDNYRVAIVTKKGVLQVKSVTNGSTHCHEYTHSRPLKKTLFKSEVDWRNSLPKNGNIVITHSLVNSDNLKKPLVAKTEPQKLKELEARFPGGVFTLKIGNEELEIEYFYHTILCRKKGIATTSFNDFSCEEIETPDIMVEWNGLYTSLSHLF